MTQIIRTWPDSLFYLSQSGTTNVREQINKTQLASTLLRALSDASTVDSTGSKLNEILTGLSLGNQSQRHKWRALYDTVNDRYTIQRNSGTDASKTWVDKLRIDSSGNVTAIGTLSTTQLIVSGVSGQPGIRMVGDLDMNDFYIRNAEDIFTNDLRVGHSLTLQNNHTVGWVYITSKTASNSPVIDFTGLTNYPKYKVEFENVRPGTDATSLLCNVSTNNGATFIASGYATGGTANSNFPGTEPVGTSGATAWNLIGDGGVTQDNAASSAITGTMFLNSLGSASVQSRGRAQLEWFESAGFFAITSDIGLFIAPGAAVNALRFSYSAGVITSGTFRLYGQRNT